MKRQRRGLFVALILGLAFALGLSACNGQSSTSAATSEVEATPGDEASATDADIATLMNQTSEPGGEPWDNTTWSTSLPEEKPKETDDLYLAVSYDWLKDAKETGEAAVKTTGDMNAIRTAFDQILSDESKTGNGLEQLRIFYNQAYDLDTLAEQGVDGIKPYVKAVMDTESLDELKALLVSEDFPFSPWITFSIAPADKRETNLVEIYPNLLLSDITMTGGDPYQDSDDPVKAQGAQQMLLTDEFYATYEAALILGTQGEEVQEIAQKIFDFEKSYAKELETTYGAASQAYGEASNSMSRAPWKNLRAHSQTSPSRSF